MKPKQGVFENVGLRFTQADDFQRTALIFPERKIIGDEPLIFTPDTPVPSDTDSVLRNILYTVLQNGATEVRASQHAVRIEHDRKSSSIEALTLMSIRKAGFRPVETARAPRQQQAARAY